MMIRSVVVRVLGPLASVVAFVTAALGGVVYIAPHTSLMTTVTLEPGQYFFRGKYVVVR